MYLSGFGIHFLGLFHFLYVLLLAKACASYVSLPNFWVLATLMKFKYQKGLCGTKLGIVKLILQTTGSVSLLVDDSFVPEDIISSVSVPQC